MRDRAQSRIVTCFLLAFWGSLAIFFATVAAQTPRPPYIFCGIVAIDGPGKPVPNLDVQVSCTGASPVTVQTDSRIAAMICEEDIL
jgi:hypothetical protein